MLQSEKLLNWRGTNLFRPHYAVVGLLLLGVSTFRVSAMTVNVPPDVVRFNRNLEEFQKAVKENPRLAEALINQYDLNAKQQVTDAEAMRVAAQQEQTRRAVMEQNKADERQRKAHQDKLNEIQEQEAAQKRAEDYRITKQAERTRLKKEAEAAFTEEQKKRDALEEERKKKEHERQKDMKKHEEKLRAEREIEVEKATWREKGQREAFVAKKLHEQNKEFRAMDHEFKLKETALKFEKIKELLGDKKVMSKVAGVASFTLASYYGYPIIFDEIARFLIKPTLVDRTTRFTLSGKNIGKMIFGEPKKRHLKVILNPELEERMAGIAKMAKNTKKHGGVFNHVLLYGKPGTGKTMWAEQLAKNSGMDFALMSGPSFDQFSPGQGVHELKKLIKWARSNKKGTIIFIDEADSFLETRETLRQEKLAVLNEFLTQTGTETGDFMVIFATNRPNVLDPAINTRIGEAIEFTLPTVNEIKLMIKQYADYFIDTDPGLKKHGYALSGEALLEDELLDSVAQRFEKEEFSGRDVMYFINALKNTALALDNPVITREIIDRVVQQRIDKKHRENEDEARREAIRDQQRRLARVTCAAA